MVAADPHQGGATWAVLQYVLGFEQLGHEVWLVDPAQPRAEAAAYFAGLDLGPRAFLGSYGGPVPDLLLNISGMLRDERVLERAPVRAYLDLDPAFNQLWHAQGVDVGLDGHTHHVTVGRRVPPTGHDWIHTLPPVVLERWPVADRIETDAFTTVANFRAYGSIEQDGVRYGQKAHSLRALLGLPTRTDERFALALDIHPDEPDLAALRDARLDAPRPASRRRVAGRLCSVRPRLQGGDRHRQGGLCRLALRLVRRPQRGLPRLGTACGRAGHRFRRAAAHRRWAVRICRHRRRARRRRSDPFRLRTACEGRPGDRGGAPRLPPRSDPAAAGARPGAARATSLDPRRDRRRARRAARRDADSPPSVRVSLQCSARRARGRRARAAAQGPLSAGSDRPGARRKAGLPARPGSRDRGVPLAARRSGSRHAGARGRRRRSRSRAVLARRREGGGNRALPARDRPLGTGGSVARAAA